MSGNFSNLKWGSIVVGVLVGLLIAVLLNIALQFGYGLILGFQLRGAPPQETLIAAYTSLPFQLMALALTLIGGIVSGRFAGRRCEGAEMLAGLQHLSPSRAQSTRHASAGAGRAGRPG